MKKKLLSLYFFLLSCCFTNAQVTLTTATGTSGYNGSLSVAGNSCVTFVIENTNSYAISINSIEMYKGISYPLNPTNLTLWYSSTSLSGAPTIAFGGWDTIKTKNNASLSFGYGNFIFSNLNFIIPASTTYRFAIQSTNGIPFSGTGAGSASPSTISGDGVNLLLGDALINTLAVGYAGIFPSPALTPRWFTGSVSFNSTIPCSGLPNAGIATSTLTSACVDIPFTLDVSGASNTAGITFQWDSSSNGTTWFPIVGATNRRFIKTQTTSSSYRCKSSCGANTSISTAVGITTPPSVSGNFTINASQPTGGGNFANFTDAINYISCGINGPVKFTVTPSSGPYNEQIVIPQIGGASAINTITFKGNGETVSFLGSTSSNKGVIYLNGADYVTIDSFNIDAATSTFGWGILFCNSANFNTIKNCTISCNATSTSVNYAGIVMNGTPANLAASGDNGNNNQILNNEIIGGYYGIYLYGNTIATDVNNNNVIKNNLVRDFYFSGIFGAYQSSGLIIANNEITRPNRTNTTTTTAINCNTGSFGAVVEKNKIHNLFDAMLANTSQFIGINVSADGNTNKEVKIINNAVYNISSNGNQFGIYNQGSDTCNIYHNTIILDDATSTAGSAYGFYQTIASNAIDFRNNLISITKGGSGTKRCLAFTNALSQINSNNNAFNFNVSGGTNNNFGQYGTTNFATFANWKTANSNAYDQLSIEADPQILSIATGDISPTNASINDIGASVGVLTDLKNVNRSSTTPDPGAIEFTVPPCTTPISSGSIVADAITCANTKFSLSLNGNSVGAGQTYAWEKSSNGTSGWSSVQAASPNPNISTQQPGTLYYRCKVKCNVDSVYTTVQLISSPSLVSGTFTINSAVATGGTNFQNYADAINYIACGINGPVTFNVVANSGPYNERVVIPAVKGTSSTNKITINGNGTVLYYTAPDANNRVALTLNGTDYTTIDSLIIDVSASTVAGWGILLTNKADSNTIKRCTINNNQTLTLTTFAGIVINGSATGAAANGNNGNANQIISNTINGGYYGIYMYGNSASNTQNINNVIKNNKFLDFYAYGIYNIYQSTGLIISNNNLSRPSRATTGTFYGVFTGGVISNALIEKNRIHNTHDLLTTNTSTTYGFYMSADGKNGAENKIVNNLIYNINNNGAVYGIYNTGGDSMQAYHNTIVLDDAATTLGASYGLYQTTQAFGVRFINNIVNITRTGTGIKRCVHYNTTTSTITSNNNILYLNVTTGTNNNVGQYGTINFSTLTDWKNANSNAFDQQSLDINPTFLNPTPDDYVPNNPIVNGIGANVGITEDINGLSRSVTPDPGAHEINISGCVNPPIAGTSTSTAVTVCPSVGFTLNISGNTVGTGQTYQWRKSLTSTGPWTNVGVLQTTPSRLTSQLTTSYYSCIITCNAGTSVFSTPILVTTPSSITGVFNINNNLPSSSTNFTSFTDAINYIVCGGMGGPVNLNVATGSGPYNEKLYIPAISGMSATNTLKINGANAVLNFNTNSNTDRAAVYLDGASNVTIDSLTIDVSKGTYGYGVYITQQATDNVISNCSIFGNTDVTTTNFIGILANNSMATIPSTGNISSNNSFINNTIVGGYTGIYLYGNSTNTTQNNNNKIIGNKISEFHTYGIYCGYQSNGLEIIKNDISRPLRSVLGTVASGIYIALGCNGINVSKNRVHNMFDGQPSNNATFYGIYIGSKAKTSTPNKVINNVIYDNNGIGATHGLYNNNADTMLAYHNTIIFDNAAGATNASTYGIYQNGQATGVEIMNNIVTNTRTGAGIKSCLAFATTTSSIKSDNNVLYSVASIANSFAGIFGTNKYVTLSNWKTANTNAYDSMSKDDNPVFTGVSQSNFIPSNTACDNIGKPLNITTDVLDLPRNAATPDAGAFEFVGTLPVNLSKLEGKVVGLRNELNWLTYTEINNDKFVIEKSANGLVFEPIGSVASKAENGMSSKTISYQFNDISITKSTNYYRLKQIDKDGKFSFSNVIVLKNEIINSDLFVMYPNPTRGLVNIITQKNNLNNKLEIIDVYGKLVYQQKITQLNFAINQTLSKGIYFVKLNNKVEKLIVE